MNPGGLTPTLGLGMGMSLPQHTQTKYLPGFSHMSNIMGQTPVCSKNIIENSV